MLGVPCSTAKLLLKAVYGIFKHGAHQRRFRISNGKAGSIVEYLVRQPVLSEPPLENNVATGGDGPQEFVLSSMDRYRVHYYYSLLKIRSRLATRLPATAEKKPM